MKRKILIGAMVLTITGLTVGGTTSTVYAASPMDRFTTLVERIAQKFGLKKEDVQKVADDYQSERLKAKESEMNEFFEARLDVAVKNKKITEAQKNLILAKYKEIQAQRLSDASKWKDMTPEERRTQQEKQRTDLEAWAKQNNIDVSYLNGWGMGMGREKGKGWMMR